MKYLKLEYPDKSIHNIIVNNFYKKDFNYVVSFYDMSESKRKYANLIKNEDRFYVDSIKEEQNIHNLEEKNLSLLPKMLEYKHKEEDKKNITVYKTKYTLFVNERLCNYYKIAKNNNKRKIKGIDCLEITQKDLEEIQKKYQSKINYVSVYEPKNTRYYNFYEEKNKFYVTRNIYELILKANLDIEATPKILDNRNCYSITKEQLDSFEEKLHYYGTKITLNEEKTLIYQDKKTNKLYLPIKAECIHSDTTILNKKCQEIINNDLSTMNLTNPIIVSVYRNIVPKVTREITVCSYEDKIYINKDIIEEFKKQLKLIEKIKIGKDIYLKINADDLDYIKEEAMKRNIILKFNLRKIAPKVV